MTTQKIRQDVGGDNEGIGGWNSLKVWEDQFDKLRQIVDGMNPTQVDAGAGAYGKAATRLETTVNLLRDIGYKLHAEWGGEDAKKALTQMNKAYVQAQEIRDRSKEVSQALRTHAGQQREWKAQYGSGGSTDSIVREIARAVGPTPSAINNLSAGDAMHQLNVGTERTNDMFPAGIKQEMPDPERNNFEPPPPSTNPTSPGGGPSMPGPGGPGNTGTSDLPGGPTSPGDSQPQGFDGVIDGRDFTDPTSPDGAGPGGSDLVGSGANGGSSLAGLGPGGGTGLGLPGGPGGGPGLGAGGLPGGPGGAPGGLAGPGGMPGAVPGGPGALGRGGVIGGPGGLGAGRGGYGAMGMPMGAGAGAGKGGNSEERERTTWLTEDEEVWLGEDGVGPGVID
ncbi:hypothetical protein [Thermomonospora cellulosilytica]|uniref:Uncharacterized protein YukE n=1 Tax=Thermomonospora cellulosilytica TaxID=1411118 RepID=A0A7W3R800_9ACTN|nr:hypothetical protein [Thermomonospora cellulosilytica]MBA9003182.1 uncharacterized protein YukE [Thermomonospora cellulosilytica]